MKKLFSTQRFIVLGFSFFLSIVFFLFFTVTVNEQLAIIRLTQLYAFTALFYLYFALLPKPLYFTFPKLSGKTFYMHILNPLVISVFYFACLHIYFAFFKQLGGFEGLFFLSSNYIIAVSFGFLAFLLLLFLLINSFTLFGVKISKKLSKPFSYILYLVGFFLLIHAVLIGTHFQDLSGIIPQVVFLAFFFLIFLELLRINAFFKKKFPKLETQINIASLPLWTFFLLSICYLFIPFPTTTGISFGIHSQHIQLANQAQNINQSPSIPGLRGDRTKRFSVSFDHPEFVNPNEETALSFRINDAANGNQVTFFEKIYEKPMHLIIVDKSLTYFNHIHPKQTKDGFIITTQFPKDGIYHLYIDFQPFGAIEQQFGFTLPIGDTQNIQKAKRPVDKNFTKKFGDFAVQLKAPNPLEASKLSIGQQELSFSIFDANSKKPIKTLKPYLGSFGHLVMINQKTYDYIHVHPTNLTPPKPDENGGPTVSFMPLGLYGPIKPGIYRVFAQFNPNNSLFTSDFTVELK